MKPCQKEAAAESGFCARNLRAPEEGEHSSGGESLWKRNGGYSSGHPGAPVIWPRVLLLSGCACWVPMFRLWPPAGLLFRSYLRDLVSLCLLPPTQAAAFCRKPACTMPLRSLLISAPPVLPPRAGSAPVFAAFLLDVFLREVGSRCGKGAKQRGIQTPSLMFSPRSLTLSEPPSPPL